MSAVPQCQHCGEEIEAGKDFCPHCGKPSAPGVAAAAQRKGDAASSSSERVVTAPPFGRRSEEKDNSRRIIFIAVGLFALLLVGGLGYLVTRPHARPGEERLEGAVRRGSPDFPPDERLMLDFDADEDATIGQNSLGNWVVTMKPTVRNFTGRGVAGLEFHAAGLDLDGKIIRERTTVTHDEIAPNRTDSPPISINFPGDNKPAQLKLEITGVKFQ
jgi:zinc-ribbon domain